MEENRSKPSSAGSKVDSPGPVALSSKRIPIRLSAARLWQNKWFLLGAAGTFMIIGLIVGAIQTPLYRVQASLEVHPPPVSGDIKSGQQVSSEAGLSYIQTEVRLVKSRSLTERAVSRLSDEERTRLLAPRILWWVKSTYDQNLDVIRDRVDAHASGQANILDISFLSPDAAAGAHFLDAVIQELSDYQVESSWRRVQHRRQWSDRQLDELRHRWEESERLLAEYTEATGAFKSSNPPPSRTVLPETGDSQLAQLKRRQVEIERELNQWLALYGRSNATADQLRLEANENASAIRARRALLTKKEKLTSPGSDSAGVEPKAGKPEVTAHLKILKQQAESSRRLYESVEAQLQESSTAPASQMSEINVVDAATSSSSPVTPNQFLNGSFGALTGLLLGGGFLALQDRYSRTFRNGEILREYLGVEVLGCLPSDSSMTETPVAETGNEPSLNIAYGHDGHTAEAYRSIRAAIFLKMENASGPQRFVLTSGAEAEGRTTVTANLGAALASAQRRVLLVDGDLRNPGLHKAFGTGNQYGLADLLSRRLTDPTIFIRDVIRATQVPDLYLLSAGQAGTLAPEVISAVHLPDLLKELGKNFDFVLIDSPPTLPYSDTRVLARAADAAVLIVRSAVTTRQSARLARDVIAGEGIPILGSILTGWDDSRTAYTC